MKILFNIFLYRFLFELTFWFCAPYVWWYFLVSDLLAARKPWPWGKLMLVYESLQPPK
ncbi:hypothetical protein [Runella zeae]|uniref:hypothetical protein n=1 Tax=Runella zeae TaxID=94255 RepID=UPI002357A41C|nr:hypothetical protein [Runella zeae]